ncbi:MULTISPECIES: hypothetical protein [Vibrio]|uniref:hypothetical protein n=1 Tax=Vibrio TaxID=662 RepID=UPI00215F2E5A|nr:MULTISPECIES: hypothetical protein [Vibrio]MCS0232448.1 hypothetical protein [Vibrio alginolyticus]MCS0276237.1 hypothetical protein [Vibrio alginolyticus]MDW1624536.1 hypothetical protein [Vibrio sp. Vb2704]
MLNEKIIESKYEDACITLDLVEAFSTLVLDRLKAWANSEIFDGGLQVETPLIEDVNAGAIPYPEDPKKAKIVITMGMLYEIYRDSMVFPIYAEKLKRDTNTFNDEMWRAFDNVSSKFSGGVPYLDDSELTPIGQALVSLWKRARNESSNNEDLEMDQEREDILTRSLACRFQMFEFMVAWVFFHELSHLIQCHYKLKSKQTAMNEIYELNNQSIGSYASQAREILADIEGLDLTLRYIHREGVYNYKSFYFILCAQTCMFNRFYSGKYDENYFVVQVTHPHPVARFEFICHYFNAKMNSELPFVLSEESRYQEIMESIYITTKSSIVSSLFWANRHEHYQGDELTSFMKVQQMSQSFIGKLYTDMILRNMQSQLPTILTNHLYHDSNMHNLEAMGLFGNQNT